MSGEILHLLDSSVLFTLQDGGLISSLWDLHISLGTMDLIQAEWKSVLPSHLISAGLQIKPLTGPEMAELFHLAPAHKRISPADLSLFVYSVHHPDTMVITGDRRLRSLCEEHDIPVHGVLWLMDIMDERGVVSGSYLADALEEMITKGNFLPEGDCDERLEKWREQKSAEEI